MPPRVEISSPHTCGGNPGNKVFVRGLVEVKLVWVVVTGTAKCPSFAGLAASPSSSAVRGKKKEKEVELVAQNPCRKRQSSLATR